jgi:hypothetical protein
MNPSPEWTSEFQECVASICALQRAGARQPSDYKAWMTAAFSRGVPASAHPGTENRMIRQAQPAAAAAFLAATLAASFAAGAADPRPEVERAPAKPQPVGALHSLRTIPEACVRLQGRFTGDAADPYRFEAVRTSPGCQPRALVLDAAKAKPSTASGWILNDRISVPEAGCPGLQAVATVWRRPAAGAPPALDAQGRSRVYLKQAVSDAKAGKLAALPAYAIATDIAGKPCR